MDERKDEQLVVDYLGGDGAAFDELVGRHVGVLYRFLARFTPTRADAEDAAQEALLKAWKNLHRYDPSRPFRTWLFTIAKNAALDLAKRRRPAALSDLEDEEGPGVEAEDPGPLPDALAERALLGDTLDRAIGTLPPKARMAFLLHYDEGFTFREIAAVLEEPLDTVKSRARRAAQTLKTRLSEAGTHPDDAERRIIGE